MCFTGVVGISFLQNLSRKLSKLLLGKDLAIFLRVLSKYLHYLLLVEFNVALSIL